MTLTEEVKRDQFFLIDPKVTQQLINAAHITREDRVLEVGPGSGFLTKELARCAKEVLAIEIDEQFKTSMETLPENVEVIYGNAYTLLNDKKFLRAHRPPTKTVSCIPYSQAQNMLHNYTNAWWYQGDVAWLAPLSLAKKVNEEPILGAYFHAEIIAEVSKTSFFPQPNTTSAILYFHRIPNPKITGDFAIYFRRWLYNHEHIKVKNVLREGIIKAAYDLKSKQVTKNDARKIIESLNIPEEDLTVLTSNIKPTYYFEIPEKLVSWFNSL